MQNSPNPERTREVSEAAKAAFNVICGRKGFDLRTLPDEFQAEIMAELTDAIEAPRNESERRMICYAQDMRFERNEARKKVAELKETIEMLSAACAELNSHATELAIDLSSRVMWALPDSVHRWNKRDHTPEKKWGEPFMDRLARAELLAESGLALARAVKQSEGKGNDAAPAAMKAYKLADALLNDAAMGTSTPPSSTDGKCSLCGSSRVPLNREGTKFGACVFPECKDSMHDYNAEQSTDGKTEGKVWSEQIAISDCCGAPTASRDNMKHNGEELVCVGTYRVCEKCRMACDYHWMNPPQTTNTEER